MKVALLFLLIAKFFSIDIVFVCNNNYAHMLATCIFSILDNKNKSDKINLYVLHPDFTEKTITTLNRICNKKCSINYIRFDLKKLKVRKDFHTMAYTKYLIPKLLPKLDKVLYLDVDILVLSSLKELWDINLEDNYVAAVQDQFNYELEDLESLNYYKKKYKNKIALMFNSGVMLLHLKKLRENDFEKKFIHEMLYEKHYFGDQPIFFFLCLDHIKYLPPKWNAQSFFFIKENYSLKESIYNNKELKELHNTPSIVHFCGNSYFSPLHPFSKLFITYMYKIASRKQIDKFIKKDFINIKLMTVEQISLYKFLKVKLMLLQETLKCF